MLTLLNIALGETTFAERMNLVILTLPNECAFGHLCWKNRLGLTNLTERIQQIILTLLQECTWTLSLLNKCTWSYTERIQQLILTLLQECTWTLSLLNKCTWSYTESIQQLILTLLQECTWTLSLLNKYTWSYQIWLKCSKNVPVSERQVQAGQPSRAVHTAAGLVVIFKFRAMYYVINIGRRLLYWWCGKVQLGLFLCSYQGNTGSQEDLPQASKLPTYLWKKHFLPFLFFH